MRKFGQIKRGGAIYFIYESDILVKASGTLTPLSPGRFNDVMITGDGGDSTTIVKSASSRLDKQNSIPVTFKEDPNYDNLSIQTGSDSVAVLYVKIGFMETYNADTDPGGLRALFASNDSTHTPSIDQALLLRILYTWLAVSNAVNRKIVITTKSFPATVVVGDPANPHKVRAKALINS